MSLINPALLAGLGLLVVPVLIHLTLKHRSRVTPFPSLMFLRAVPFKTTSRRRIRHPLLFALRCLAIALLVLAFARPFMAGGDRGGSAEARDVVVLLDTSGSLGFGDRRDRVLREARAVVDEIGEEDRVGLVTFDDRAVEQTPLGADVAVVREALDALRPTDRPTRIEAGLQLAGRLLGGSDRALREIVLVSDFQRTGWEGDGRVRLPDGVTLRTIDVGDSVSPNVAVADVQFVGTEADDRHRVVARVVNLGDDAVAGLAVSLEVAGRNVATQSADLEPRGAATVAFEDVPLPSGDPPGSVIIAADGLRTDDELRFVARPNPVLEAALLTGPGGRADRSLYLERALALADAPGVRVDRQSADGYDFDRLPAGGVAILNDVAPGDAGWSATLLDWVRAGGALLVVLGPAAAPAGWAPADSALLGGTVGPIADRASRGGNRISWIDYDHPVFEAFTAPRSGDFSAARFFRFRAFEPVEGARVLARFEDGEPALVEHAVGDGRVMVWTSTVDRFWNDLALQPVFLPFVHRLLGHAASYETPERWTTSGQQIRLADLLGDAALASDGEWVLVTPRGERLPIERSDDPTWIEFPDAGFYRVEAVGGGTAPVTVAVNLPLAESALDAVAPARVADAVVGAPETTARPAENQETRASGPIGQTELWWPLLALAAVVLAIESVVANRLSPRRAQAGAAHEGRET